MKLNSKVLSILVLVIVVSGIGLALALNLWQSKPDPALLASMESTMSNLSNSDNATAAVIDVTIPTPYNPADIKGTNTFKEISAMFYIPLSDLGKAFGLSSISNFSDMRARELKTIYTNLGKGITLETESVRIFVAMYKSKPYSYSNTAYLPQPAVTILKDRVKLSKEQLAFLDTHTLDISNKLPSATAVQTNIPVITGETSFQRMLDLGVPVSEIEKVLGAKLPATGILIRDYASQKGLDFLIIVNALQEKVNSIYKAK